MCPGVNVVFRGCILYKEGLYAEAIEKFNQAVQLAGSKAPLSYNVALCFYQLRQYAQALKHIADIIERGIKEHPELSVGLTTEGIDVRSVGNTQLLHETALIEAFNLKAAIEYQLRNLDAAAEAMTDMPVSVATGVSKSGPIGSDLKWPNWVKLKKNGPIGPLCRVGF